MDVVGFVWIDKNATTCHGAKNPAEFIGETCAVMEFSNDGGVLVLNPQGTALAMFEKEDVRSSFKCILSGDIVCPPNQHPLETMAYVGRCISRKGGYNNLLKRMVIESSLLKGEFNDNFLWQKQ